MRPGPTRATVLMDDGPVTILPRRAPVGNSGPLRGRTLVVLPIPLDRESSAEQHGETILAVLPPGPRDCYSATVEPGGQVALAAADLSETEALAAARALGLAEILFWDGRRARLVSCNGS